jgi:predicted nucleic acid-binding Zn ribbon protein
MARRGSRSGGDFERLGADVRAELARFGPQAGMAELLERWPAAVGDAIARQAWPARIARDGTLHVNTTDSVWSFELGQRAAEIAGRLGVPAVRFAPGPLPEPAAETVAAPALEPAAEDVAQAAALVASIGDEELRKTVQRALSLSLAKERSDRPF